MYKHGPVLQNQSSDNMDLTLVYAGLYRNWDMDFCQILAISIPHTNGHSYGIRRFFSQISLWHG